jgi:membrane protease YdiL (CAAX protease family)
MKGYLRNRWFRAGLVIVAVGWTPLLAIIFLADAGLWPDQNPNPVGPGILFAFTGWPAIICLVIGIVRVKRAHRSHGAAAH